MFFFFSLFLYLTAISNFNNNLDFLFENMVFFILLVCPLLAARLIGEEEREGTSAFLFLSPYPLFSMVIGKYLSAVAIFLFWTILTLVPLIAFSFISPCLLVRGGNRVLATPFSKFGYHFPIVIGISPNRQNGAFDNDCFFIVTTQSTGL